jgi:hypothetical protein
MPTTKEMAEWMTAEGVETWADEDLRQDQQPGEAKEPEPWWPLHNTTQREIFMDTASTIFMYGPKGSGKTLGGLDLIVRHCWENHNALVLACARSIRVINKGACSALENTVLPRWKDGNRAPPAPGQPEGKLLDTGIGLEYSPAKLDPQTKDRTLWIRNRFGTKSYVIFIAMPHESDIDQRIRGIEPSMVYFEEIDTCDSPKYYRRLRAQLGRRKGITGVQPFVASFNPVGPSHWLYKLGYETTVDNEHGRVWPNDPEQPGIKRRRNFSWYFVPFTENLRWLSQEYLEELREAYADDPVEQARLVEGKWMDRPSGEAIFKNHFNKEIHVKGDAKSDRRISPVVGLPLTIGYDLGDVNHGIVFMQQVPTKEKMVWLVFDEIVIIRQQVSYEILAPQLLRKMNHWCERAKHAFFFEHISDKSAFNRFRAIAGGFDHGALEAMTMQELRTHPGAYPWIDQPVRFQECPRPEQSVEFRAKLTMGFLGREELFIDAHCVRTIDSLENIEGDRDKPLNPKKNSTHKHAYDALTYPIFYHKTGGRIINLKTESEEPCEMV